MHECRPDHYEIAGSLIRQHGLKVTDFLQAKMEMLREQLAQEPSYRPIVAEWKCIEEAVRQLQGSGDNCK